jgi:hypothetical protein
MIDRNRLALAFFLGLLLLLALWLMSQSGGAV